MNAFSGMGGMGGMPNMGGGMNDPAQVRWLDIKN